MFTSYRIASFFVPKKISACFCCSFKCKSSTSQSQPGAIFISARGDEGEARCAVFTTHLESSLQHRKLHGSFTRPLLFAQLSLNTIYLQAARVSSRISAWQLRRRRERWSFQRRQMQVSHHRLQTLPFSAEL